MLRFVLATTLTTALGATAHAQTYDASGTDTSRRAPVPSGVLELDVWANTHTVTGLTVREGQVWGMGSVYGDAADEGVLFRFDDQGQVVEQVPLAFASDFTFALGYDQRRDLFLVPSVDAHKVYRVHPDGTLDSEFVVPHGNPVGVAYDLERDAYWITDWTSDSFYVVSAGTFADVKSCHAPAGSRISGGVHVMHGDVLYYHGRDQFETYAMKASDCSVVKTMATPGAHVTNGGQGTALMPDGRILVSNWDDWMIYTLDPTL